MTSTQYLLETLKRIPKTYFSLNDIQKFAKGKLKSLPVMLFRLVQQGRLQRIMRGYFTFDLTRVDWEEFACSLRKPSCISLEYALYYYGFLDQVPEIITLVTPGVSRIFSCNGKDLEYSHIKRELFFAYEISENALIATKEKALLDELYLISLKKRHLTINPEWFKKIDRTLFRKWLKKYPSSVKKLVLDSFTTRT